MRPYETERRDGIMHTIVPLKHSGTTIVEVEDPADADEIVDLFIVGERYVVRFDEVVVGVICPKCGSMLFDADRSDATQLLRSCSKCKSCIAVVDEMLFGLPEASAGMLG